MRSASFVVAGSGGSMAAVSLVILPGQAGGLLRNINQWRAQLGLPKLDEAAFESTAQWVTTPVGLGAVIHLTGLAPGADPAFDGRTVVVELAMQTWFFKMRGNSELVAVQREAFLKWVAGVRLAESEDPPSAPPYGIPPVHAPPGPGHPSARRVRTNLDDSGRLGRRD